VCTAAKRVGFLIVDSMNRAAANSKQQSKFSFFFFGFFVSLLARTSWTQYRKNERTKRNGTKLVKMMIENQSIINESKTSKYDD
jgi:hypothetical protein